MVLLSWFATPNALSQRHAMKDSGGKVRFTELRKDGGARGVPQL